MRTGTMCVGRGESRVTNGPVFPGHVLFSRPALAVRYGCFFIKWWKCPGFQKTAGKDQLYSKI